MLTQTGLDHCNAWQCLCLHLKNSSVRKCPTSPGDTIKTAQPLPQRETLALSLQPANKPLCSGEGHRLCPWDGMLQAALRTQSGRAVCAFAMCSQIEGGALKVFLDLINNRNLCFYLTCHLYRVFLSCINPASCTFDFIFNSIFPIL